MWSSQTTACLSPNTHGLLFVLSNEYDALQSQRSLVHHVFLCSAFSPDHWSALPEAFCGGKQQSPVDIDTKGVVENASLEVFSFTHFDDKKAMKYVINTGHTGETTASCVVKGL